MAKKKSPFDVLQKRPNRFALVEGLNHQGLLLLQQGQFQAGADLLAQSLAHNPHQPEVYYNFGFALQQLGLLDSAIQAYGQSIALSPNDTDALMSRGHVLATQQRYAEATVDFAKAVKLVPQNADAWNNYGNVLLELAREPEAIEAYDKALSIRPNFAQALFNKGKALGALERYAEAAQAYAASLKINSNYEEAKWHLSWVTLVLGNLAAGWPLFEARWTVPALGNQRRYPQLPQWLGQAPLAGKNLLLYAEQGLGDTLQFCRYVPMLQAMGAQVSLAVQAPLVPLLAEQWPGVAVAASFADVAQFDWATPLMSLPLALGTTLATVLADVPYIRIPELGHSVTNNRPRVGLVWSGSTAHKNDKNRSLPLATLVSMFELPVDWVCLNPEWRDADAAWLAQHPQVVLERPVLTDFAETARVIAQLDCVITVDTSVAHLAGAMGKPVWILLPTGPDYRWLLEREDSPWYPTARLFRQAERGDWSGVVSRVANELKRFFAPRTDTSI
jgi:tetratricopeptide (TPR) repeat protein